MGLLGAAVVGGAIGRRSARRQMEGMQAAQAQQQAAQAQAQAAQAQAQAPIQGKKDPYQELEKLGNLKKQGLLSEEEFQKMKTQIISGM
ncbi:MAG TPA: SHOCT domain-containing protein [Nitrososphaeraceae archaeon]|nr:SHOCT domain-containing protein [Nitrososphaeraceae archaeon]